MSDRTPLLSMAPAAIALALALLSPLASRKIAASTSEPQPDTQAESGTPGRFGAEEAGGQRWLHLSSRHGDLPMPTTSRQQTAAVVADLDKDGASVGICRHPHLLSGGTHGSLETRPRGRLAAGGSPVQ